MRAPPQLDWDYADRLQHTLKSNGSNQDTYFTYGADGQRVRKVYEHGGTREERIYLGGYEVYRRSANTAGAVPTLERTTLHVMDDQRRVVMVETKTRDDAGTEVGPLNSPRWRYQLENHLGSSGMELDQSGGVISYEEYHPYGSTAFSVRSGSAEVSAKRYRYTGKERDEETGLYYHGARYYAPWLGRWTSADPLGVDEPGRPDLDLYAYCAGDPIGRNDPEGLDPPQQQAGVGLTFSSEGVRFGPIGLPAEACDNLSPSCASFRLTREDVDIPLRMPPLQYPLPTMPSLPQGPFVFRGSDVDPLPTVNGFEARAPGAATSPVEHALGAERSPWISVTESVEAAESYGRPYAISVPEANTDYVSPTELQEQVRQAVEDGAVERTRGEAWQKAQTEPHPASPKPGEPVESSGPRPTAPPEYEGVMRDRIPPEAVVPAERLATAARTPNQIKWVSRINTASRALGIAGLALAGTYIGFSAAESIQTGDPRPVVSATVEVATAFGTAYGFAQAGLVVGGLVGGPIGAAAGGLIGGLAGGFVGSKLGKAFMDWVW